MASSAAASKVERGHQLYRDGRYNEALVFYTEALSAAKTKPQEIALHSNRAACFLKLHHFKKAAEECTSVLELDQKHSGALMLRAQTLVTLKEYHNALFDVNRLIELNPNSEVYRDLEARLRTQLSLAPIPECEAEFEEEEEENNREEGLAKHVEEEGGEKDDVDQMKNQNLESILTCKRDVKAGLIQPVEKAELFSPKTPDIKESPVPDTSSSSGIHASQVKSNKGLSESQSNGWQAIPKPKGHSTLDYARWNRVEDDSSDDDDDDEDDENSQPQYRFRVRTVGVRPVK